ncbi:MAG: hypothetical protein PVTTEEND_001320 [Candidatus Fervidibacter sp.]|jgi:hypothetical protein
MRWLPLVAVLLLLATIAPWAVAQCAMCQATVQSSGNANLMAGLRSGIFLLLVMPYLIAGTIALAVYVNYRRSLRWWMVN